ncbi:hypothetical protein ACP70R_049286 [Stipagrostis hirtigluma subsp. patula]
MAIAHRQFFLPNQLSTSATATGAAKRAIQSSNVYVRRKVESEHSKVNTSQELKGESVEQVPSKPPVTESVKQVPSKPPVTESAEQVPSKPPVTESAEQVPSKPPVTESVEQVPSKPPVTESLEQVPSKPPVTESAEQVPSKPPVTESVEQVPSKPPVTESIEQVPSKPPVTESVEQVSSKPPEKPNAGVTPEKIEPPVASGTGIQDDIQQASIQYWNERFNRLQTYLENCDRSNQETYLRKLRSLSAAGRSMHAIELEKRAIHLLVEEGKELQRMKALNVLGKVSPNASSKQTPLQRQLQK